ncbi:MAG: hypothetical protein SH817_02020 [Leptospira sp.]|nr:hypothetical protein [Leptospira sp.]
MATFHRSFSYENADKSIQIGARVTYAISYLKEKYTDNRKA